MALSISKIKTSIDLTGADVVFLQEVIGHSSAHAEMHEDWPNAPQFEYLADRVWDHFAYGKNAIYSTGHHGNAILSRFPILSWSNTDISTNPYESRGFLHARISVPPHNTEIHLICVHLDLLEKGRMAQIQKLGDYIDSELSEQPLIVAGDFNDWSGRASGSLEARLGLTEVFRELNGYYPRTFPAFMPLLSLDRILVRGFRPRSGKVLRKGHWMRQSDHAALLAELEPNG